ncbi:MAG: hypothetical protein AAGB02_01440 [Pseudomonadota bacterium]
MAEGYKEMQSHLKKFHLLFFLILLNFGCVSPLNSKHPKFSDAVQSEGRISIVGWARIRGEVLLFANNSAMTNKLRYPDCISAVFTDHDPKPLLQFDGKKVFATGTIYEYEKLKNENRQLIPRKMLFNSVIPNFCFGKNVMLLSEIQLTE